MDKKRKNLSLNSHFLSLLKLYLWLLIKNKVKGDMGKYKKLQAC